MAYQEIQEEQEKTAVFTFGRNNPPTIGHEKLFDKTLEVAKEHNSKAHLITSHSQDPKKNPLSTSHKVSLIKHAYPEAHVSSSSKSAPSIFHLASKFHNQGAKHLVMVAGSDRVDEYHKQLHKYNGIEGNHGYYNFKSIKVVSAGQRDPDAEGAEGMSGTKLRSHAISGNKDKFKSGLMSKLSNKHKEEVYNNVRSALNVKEVYDPHLKISKYQWGEKEGVDKMKSMTPGESKKSKKIREEYVAGKLFPIGQYVSTHDGKEGRVTYRGSNYITIQEYNGNAFKSWLDEVFEKDNDEYPYIPSNRIKEQKVPILLMNTEQKKLLQEETQQLEFDGVQTKNFDMCKDAYNLFKGLIDDVRAGRKIGEEAGHEGEIQSPKDSEKLSVIPSETKKRMQFKNYLEL